MAETRGSVLLRGWLETSGTSQADLASLIGDGVHQTSVSAWARGAQPRAKFVGKLHALAGIPPEAWGEAVAEPRRHRKAS